MGFALFAGGVRGADPRIDRFEPQGARRGSEQVVAIHGGRIGVEAAELIFAQPGISVQKLETVGPNHINATLAIAEDCALGIHPVRVRTASGISNLMTLHIGALEEIVEQEPNNEFAAPQAIALDVVVSGLITNEDVDYFVVEAEKGERLSVEIEGLRLGRTFFDPAIAILNEARFELAASDDSALLRQDGYASLIVPETGKYVISVRETAYRGSGASTYRLHVGRFPRPAAVYPPGGQPGQQLEVRWIGDPGGEWTESITLPAEAVGDDGLLARDERGVSPSPVPIRVMELPNALEVEPNNGRAEATECTLPAACVGIIQEAGDVDFFRFTATKGTVIDFTAYARQIRSPLDPVMRVFDEAGKNLAGNDDNAGKPDSYFRFTAPGDGQYTLQIHDHLRAGGADFIYRIEARPPQPVIDLQVEEDRRYFATVADVPQGGRTAVMMRATRRDVGGALELLLEGLPAGVTAEAIPLAADYNRIPVVLSAAADAPLAGGLVRLSTNHEQAASRFEQQTWLVRGRNNVPVWSYFGDRWPVAVTKPLPFRLTIAQPKSPLVRSGSKQLQITAERDEGFTAPIKVRTLYDPPGVSSNRSQSIAENATEVAIPTTAAGNARLGEWPIAVVGEANVGGRVIAATQFVTLRVAEPYLALQFPTVATIQGEPVEFIVPVEVKTPFEGPAQVQLLGLPPGVTTEPAEINKESKQVVFPLQVAADARVGRHERLFCQITVTEQGEPVPHTIGYGKLHIDPPPPPEEDPAAPTAEEVAQRN